MSSKLPSVTSPPWDMGTKRVVSLVIVLVSILVASRVGSSAWTTLLVTLVLAYLMSPLVTFFERRVFRFGYYDLRRTVSVLLAWVIVLAALGLFVGLVVPAMVAQFRQFADDLPDLIEGTEEDLKNSLDRPITVGDFEFVPWDELQKLFKTEDGDTSGDVISDRLKDAATTLVEPLLGILGSAVSFFFNALVMLMMLFYLMRDGPKFVEHLVGSIPESYRGDTRRLMHELGLIWNAYLRGQLFLCTVMGLATYIAALILGLPQPLLLGLVAGFFEIIPNIGPALSQVPALLFALTTPSSTIAALDAGLLYAVVVSVSYMVLQQLEAMFLVPRIMGSSLDLHPFVVLVAIIVGASLAGVLGVILAAPSVATVRLFGRYLRAKLLDEELFPTLPSGVAQQRGFVYRLMFFFLSKRFPSVPPEEWDAWQPEPEPLDLSSDWLRRG